MKESSSAFFATHAAAPSSVNPHAHAHAPEGEVPSAAAGAAVGVAGGGAFGGAWLPGAVVLGKPCEGSVRSTRGSVGSWALLSSRPRVSYKTSMWPAPIVKARVVQLPSAAVHAHHDVWLSGWPALAVLDVRRACAGLHNSTTARQSGSSSKKPHVLRSHYWHGILYRLALWPSARPPVKWTGLGLGRRTGGWA